MKRNYLRSLLLLAAMVWAVPKVAAAEYELGAPAQVWLKAYTETNGNYSVSAVVGDAIYSAPGYSDQSAGNVTYYAATFSTAPTTRYTTIGHYIDNENGGKEFSYGSWTDPDGASPSTENCYYSAGQPIAADADGVLWLKAKLGTTWGPVNNATQFLYYASGKLPNPFQSATGTKTLVSLESQDLTARVDRMTAYGHTTTSEGGALWLIPNTYTSIVKFPVVNGAIGTMVSYNLPDGVTINTNNRIVTQYAADRILFDNGENLYKGVISGTSVTWTKLGVTALGGNSTGATMFELQGHEVVVYSSSATQVAFYDVTAQKSLGSVTPFSTQGSSAFGRHGIHAKVSGNTASVYVYVPGQGAAKYSITATEVIHYTDPVQSLEAARAFNDDASQTVTLTWAAPATGVDRVTGYTIYKDGMQAATVAAGVTTWVDNAFTATTTYNVVPTYDTGETGTDATKAVTFYEFKAPTNLKATHFDGYARVVVTYSKVAKCDGLYVRYEVIRNDNAIVTGLNQGEYVDTYIPPGEHTYTVEAVFYKQDADGRYTVEIKRLRSDEQVTVTVNQLTATLVNYTLEEVYNHEMWDIWNADRANGSKLPENFDPNRKEGSDYIDAEHYRQGALVTDADGKKWWYIMQRSNSLTKESTNGTSSGILKISAEDDQLKAGGNASMLTLPTEIKHAQSVGIATDASGNIFVRGWNQKYDDLNNWTYNNTHNYIGKLLTGVIYSADLTKSFNVSFENIDFDTESVIAENADSKERIDYYRVSGDLMGTAYLYVVAGCSRTMTVVKLVNDGSTVTATQEYQYTPTTLDSGTEIKVSASDGYENYAFPIEETLAGSKGYVWQKRSVAYLYVPDGSTAENHDIYVSEGKIANSGGTTAKMSNANEATAAQLFIITPQSFYSRNIGSFSIGLVPENKFTNAVVPIANYVQQGSENINADANADNCNGNWLFAEWDEGDPGVTGDENLYIYQYVPGIRIAKYRLYGNVSFYPSVPELTIETKHDENREHITHFEAKATWGTPADYNQAGDYAIRYYNVELLDAGNNVIDSRQVPATENGSDWKGEFSKQSYSVTFSTTADLNAGTGVATGDSDNHFVDNASLYSVRVTPVYDLTQVLRGTTTAASDLRSAATMTSQDIHDYEMNTPSGTVQIYKGTGAVKNVYRVEIDITDMEDGEEPVSHYELSYSYTPSATARSGETVTVPINDFILVTADSQTENSSVVPGVNVRNGNNGYGMTDSQGKSYVMFYVDNRLFEDRDGNGYGEYYYPEETAEQIPSNWTYSLTAVYAAGNSLLRNSTTAAMNVSKDMIETGVETADAGEEVAFSAFPIPAESTLTVRAPQGIETVTVISEAGVVVKSVAGNGDGVMTIAVDDLASGHYLLRVNNLTPIKIVKR